VKYSKSLIVFGERVRQLRKEKKMTQLDLSIASDIDRRTIQRIENGTGNPTFEIMVGLALGLQILIKELMDFEIQENPYLS